MDLFHPTQALFQASSSPLTINGVHLTEEGNRQLSEIIATSLLGRRVSASSAMEPLRKAIVDKDYHWNNRYRARDGNDVWGGRSKLTFVNDQSNAVVLQHEQSMLDIMTANRDVRVWSVANGKNVLVDDSNVPKPVEVISNVGGGSKSSSAMKEGTRNYIGGEEAIQHMAVAQGFEVSLFADESKFPQLANPVQLQFDTKGRLWAAVWPTYPKWEPLKEMNDALIILHDDNSDGKAIVSPNSQGSRILWALSFGMEESSSRRLLKSSFSRIPTEMTWPMFEPFCFKGSTRPTRTTPPTT